MVTVASGFVAGLFSAASRALAQASVAKKNSRVIRVMSG
jgi:hypothetical protein